MKTVFTSSEICHVFARQSQESGKTSSRNIFFEGKEIFSYGRHFCMAKILDAKRVLITDRNYSVTTSGHLSGLRYALNHLESLSVPYGVRLRTYLINNYYSILYSKKHFGEYKQRGTEKKWSYKRLSKIQFLESDCPFTGMAYDYNFLDSIRKFILKPDRTNIKELLSDCVDNVILCVEKEIEYQNTSEAITETIESNDFEFTEEGEQL